MGGRVLLWDSTLCDERGLANDPLSDGHKLEIVKQLDRCGVPETVVVSADRVSEEIRFSRRVKAEGLGITLSGQIHAGSPDLEVAIQQTTEILDRVDILIPLSERHRPVGAAKKITVLLEALDYARSRSTQIGVGFHHAMEASPLFLLEVVQHATRGGAQRLTLYDTTGEAEPFSLRSMLEELIAEVRVPVFFHARDQLGLAVANSWAAVLAGARGLGVTVGGRRAGAGNASLEQVADLLERNKIATGVDPHELNKLEALVQSSG